MSFSRREKEEKTSKQRFTAWAVEKIHHALHPSARAEKAAALAAALKEEYLNECKKAEYVALDDAEKLKHVFTKRDKAYAFVNWLEQKRHRFAVETDTSQSDTKYQVNLTREDFEFFMGPDEFARLLPITDCEAVIQQLKQTQTPVELNQVFIEAKLDSSIFNRLLISYLGKDDFEAILANQSWRNNFLTLDICTQHLGESVMNYLESSSRWVRDQLVRIITTEEHDVLLEFMQRFSQEAIYNTFIVADESHITPFSIAASALPEFEFLNFLSLLSIPAINVAMNNIDQRYDYNTSLTTLALQQSTNSCVAVINKLTSTTLVNLANSGALELILLNQSPVVTYAFMVKLPLEFRFDMRSHSQAFNIIIEYLKHESSWQELSFIERVLRHFSKTKLRQLLNEQRLTRYRLPSNLLTILDQDNTVLFKPALVLNPEGLVINAEDSDLAEAIWQKGLDAKPAVIQRLREMKDEKLQDVLDSFSVHQELFVHHGMGEHLTFDMYRSLFVDNKTQPSVAQLTTLARKNKLAIKVVRPKHIDGFISQLKDYHYRPAIRAQKTYNDSHVKFVHLTEEIVRYDPVKKTKVPTHTKKTSATLISRHLNSALFGQHDSRDLVGICLDLDNCIIKAMLGQDHGTFHRSWVGTQDEVNNYASLMKKINFTSFATFSEHVNYHPYRVNEILIKISREAVLGIMIATDTAQARQTAVEYQTLFETQLNRQVPIVFYQRMQRDFAAFTLENTHHKCTLLKGAKSFAVLAGIKKDIQEKKDWTRPGFFGTKTTLTKTAQKALAKITSVENFRGLEAFGLFYQTENEIRHLFVNTQKKKDRPKEIEDFYQGILGKYF